MKNVIKHTLLLTITALLLGSCNRNSSNTSSLTGWNFNDPNYGNYIKGKTATKAAIPPGMVAIEGGSFTMGMVQDDVMFDWNTTPKKMHIRSFYMDEAEVTNAEYGLFLQYIKDVFPPDEEQFKHIYASVLPDTLVWRKGLGNTDLLAETYFRHPAYADYPVVGVSWLQANKYCKWRTDAVNYKLLVDSGVMANIYQNDSLSFKGKNSFNTEAYLANPDALFDGDSTIYKKGVPVKLKKGATKPAKGSFTGRHVSIADGILTQKFRLPTEAEWEYAAKANVENREYNNIRGRKKYAWNGKYTRNKNKRDKGNQLANFKQGKGDYSGISGWSSDNADIPTAVKSYAPNAFGLYDMSGNVSEWVADVYRPLVDAEANDFNYFRGNIYNKNMIGKDGKVVIVADGDVAYDTLENGMISVRDLPGSLQQTAIDENDTYMRRNYNTADNTNVGDGDKGSTRFYDLEDEQFAGVSRMYNSPEMPQEETDEENGVSARKYDAKSRTTLISNHSRVYKGGSWKDREYWLDPSQRRYFSEYMATSYIGFRCATDVVGPMSFGKRKSKAPGW